MDRYLVLQHELIVYINIHDFLASLIYADAVPSAMVLAVTRHRGPEKAAFITGKRLLFDR